MEQITTIGAPSESRFKEKGSVFIGRSFMTESTEEISEILAGIKKEFYDATHHCYAYRTVDGNFKYSDDGEPNGTAGIRILNAIDHFKLTNTLVIVIRYYGGTKLGVGPLGKAYYTSALSSLESAPKITKKAYRKVVLEADFSDMNYVHKAAADWDIKIQNSSFDEKSHFDCLAETNKIEGFCKELTELSNGRIGINTFDSVTFI